MGFDNLEMLKILKAAGADLDGLEFVERLVLILDLEYALILGLVYVDVIPADWVLILFALQLA